MISSIVPGNDLITGPSMKLFDKRFRADKKEQYFSNSLQLGLE